MYPTFFSSGSFQSAFCTVLLFSLYPWIGLHVHFSNFFRNSSRAGIVCVCVCVCVSVCVFIWVYVLIFIVPQTFQIIYISSVDERVCEGNPEQKHAFFDNLVVVIQSLSSIQLFCDSTDCSLPGSSVHGISQTRILKWVAISLSEGSSQSRDQT